MRNNKLLSVFFVFIVLSLSVSKIEAEHTENFRENSFEDKGYLISYRIAQGENLDNMFEELGFDLLGSFSNGVLNVLLRERSTEFRDIYYIESDKFILTQETVYSIESYLVLEEPLTAEINTGSDFIADFIGFNFEPVESEIIHAELPKETAIIIPTIFTNITRPNFGAMIKDANYFDFLPLIIGEDFDRYEAEFTSLLLDESFSVNIYNKGDEEFTISLDIKLETSISLRATWNKYSGLLTALSVHLIYGGKSSVLVISLESYEEILSPLDSHFMQFFITNSSSRHEIYQLRNSTKEQLELWDHWINQLNQTYGLRYLFSKSGLNFQKTLYVYDKLLDSYFSSTPVHGSWIAQIPPVLIPTWDKYLGMTILAEKLWEQLHQVFHGFQFTLTGVTSSLFTIREIDFHIEYQKRDNLHHILWEFSFDYQSNNTQTVVPRLFIQDTKVYMNGWLAYTEGGQLQSFSLEFQEFYHSYYDPHELDSGNNYFFEYYIESVSENITKPEFVSITETPHPFHFEQIIFYCILAYSIIKKKRKRRN
ncbi:MAG: hypothetical protein H7644_02930 [Candidatus Heimdallarchaeota archaeon]|nr:hypothetical protein [Candidatus Heimdallarchaeota archaeon]MCK5142695.1 hypothetical protein [Candidatus Heimdallarchaeota archaeon]